MDTSRADRPPLLPDLLSTGQGPADVRAPDGLGTEVRESLVLLLLSLAVTAGVAAAASALLSLLA